MVVEEKYMARCIELAQGGEGNTASNPMVGAAFRPGYHPSSRRYTHRHQHI